VYWSQAYRVPAELVEAVAWQESGWQNRAVSSAGAVGIGQLMPQTASYIAGQLLGLKLKATVPDDNIRMSARLLEELLTATGGSLCETVTSYYQGLDTLHRVGVLQETQPYVKNVLALMPRYAQGWAAGKKSPRP
jgi:soluble lytic murein transglycosylase-like protein